MQIHNSEKQVQNIPYTGPCIPMRQDDRTVLDKTPVQTYLETVN